MGPEFFQTVMGHKFYKRDIPRIADALEKIGKELELLRLFEFKKLKENEVDSSDIEG